MSREVRVRLFVSAITALALSCTLLAFSHFNPIAPPQFLCYLLVATVASGLKVVLPGVDGTLSVSFFFILLGITELGLAETLILGFATVVVQSYWHRIKRLRPIQVLFNLSQLIVSTCAAHAVFRLLATHLSGNSKPLSLVGAAIAYFLCNTAAMSTIISLSDDKPFKRVWMDSYFWSFAYYLGGAAIVEVISVLNRRIGWQATLLALPPIYLIYRSLRLYINTLHEEKQHALEMSSLHFRTTEALALAIQAKDQTTHEHLQRVRVYAMELAKDLGLNSDEIEALRAASLLHDIGKLAVPEHIISKPGKLTEPEFEQMKVHPVVGAQILEQVRFPYPVVPIVRSHHEKWDGSGYPDGLKGEEIPIGARILSAVDCLDALASDRQYRKAMPLPEAMARVQAEAGKTFDPHVVNILSERYVELEQMAHDAAARNQSEQLAVNIKISKGLAPGAGFEVNGGTSTSSDLTCASADQIASALVQSQKLFDSYRHISAEQVSDVLAVFADRLRKSFALDEMIVHLVRGRTLVAEYCWSRDPAFSSLRIPLGEGLCGWVAENAKSILNGNPLVDPGYLPSPGEAPLASALAIPLHGRSEVVAVLAIYRRQPDAFTSDDLRFVEAFSFKLGYMLESAANCEGAYGPAPHTSPKQLPRMVELFEHVEQEIRSRQQANQTLTVFAITWSQSSSEESAVDCLYTALVNEARKCDYIVRTGANEFASVVCDVSPNKAARIADSMQRSGSRAISGAGSGPATVSVGYAVYPEDATAIQQLWALAQRRMHAGSELPSGSATQVKAAVAGQD